MGSQELEDQIKSVECDKSIMLQVPHQMRNPHPIIIKLHSGQMATDRYNPRSNKIHSDHKVFNMTVSKQNLIRAKLILDTFIKAVVGRGHQIYVEQGETYVEAYKEKLKIRLWEKSKYT